MNFLIESVKMRSYQQKSSTEAHSSATKQKASAPQMAGRSSKGRRVGNPGTRAKPTEKKFGLRAEPMPVDKA